MSILVCLLTIFTIIFNMFVPIKTYADVISDLRSRGYNFVGGLPGSFDYSNVTLLDGYNYLAFCCEVNGTYDSIYFYFYDNSYSDVPLFYDSSGCYIIHLSDKTYCYILSIDGSYRSYGSSLYLATSSSKSSTIIHYGKIPSLSFFDRLGQGLFDLWYNTGDNTIDLWFSDDNLIDYWDNIGNDWCDFVKTVLDINDDNTLNTVLTDIYNNDYSSDYWTNIDNTTINQIQNTSNNLEKFWQNNVTVVDDGDNNYHYEIKNYNPVTNTYPDYLYNDNYFTEYILYNTDTNNDDVVYWLKRIYNALEEFFSNFSFSDTNDDYNDTEFIKEVKNIIIKKIPLLGQCIEILEPATNICIDNLDNDDIDLIEDSHTTLLTEQYNFVSLSSEESSNITYSLYDDLIVLQVTPYKSLKSKKFNLFNSEFDFEINLEDYYNNYRMKVSNILLFFSYLLFAWSIIRRSSKLFGHDSDKE